LKDLYKKDSTPKIINNVDKKNIINSFLVYLDKFDKLPVMIYVSKNLEIYAEFDKILIQGKFSENDIYQEIQRIAKR
jgi:hypothetical protein